MSTEGCRKFDLSNINETVPASELKFIVPDKVNISLWIDDVDHDKNCQPNLRSVRLVHTIEPHQIPSAIPHSEKFEEIFKHALRAHCGFCNETGRNQLEALPFR